MSSPSRMSNEDFLEAIQDAFRSTSEYADLFETVQKMIAEKTPHRMVEFYIRDVLQREMKRPPGGSYPEGVDPKNLKTAERLYLIIQVRLGLKEEMARDEATREAEEGLGGESELSGASTVVQDEEFEVTEEETEKPQTIAKPKRDKDLKKEREQLFKERDAADEEKRKQQAAKQKQTKQKRKSNQALKNFNTSPDLTPGKQYDWADEKQFRMTEKIRSEKQLERLKMQVMKALEAVPFVPIFQERKADSTDEDIEKEQQAHCEQRSVIWDNYHARVTEVWLSEHGDAQDPTNVNYEIWIKIRAADTELELLKNTLNHMEENTWQKNYNLQAMEERQEYLGKRGRKAEREERERQADERKKKQEEAKKQREKELAERERIRKQQAAQQKAFQNKKRPSNKAVREEFERLRKLEQEQKQAKRKAKADLRKRIQTPAVRQKERLKLFDWFLGKLQEVNEDSTFAPGVEANAFSVSQFVDLYQESDNLTKDKLRAIFMTEFTDAMRKSDMSFRPPKSTKETPVTFEETQGWYQNQWLQIFGFNAAYIDKFCEKVMLAWKVFGHLEELTKELVAHLRKELAPMQLESEPEIRGGKPDYKVLKPASIKFPRTDDGIQYSFERSFNKLMEELKNEYQGDSGLEWYWKMSDAQKTVYRKKKQNLLKKRCLSMTQIMLSSFRLHLQTKKKENQLKDSDILNYLLPYSQWPLKSSSFKLLSILDATGKNFTGQEDDDDYDLPHNLKWYMVNLTMHPPWTKASSFETAWNRIQCWLERSIIEGFDAFIYEHAMNKHQSYLNWLTDHGIMPSVFEFKKADLEKVRTFYKENPTRSFALFKSAGCMHDEPPAEFYKNVSIENIERSLAFLYAVHAADRNARGEESRRAKNLKQHQYPNYSAKDSSPDTELWMVASSLDGERNPYSVDLAFL